MSLSISNLNNISLLQQHKNPVVQDNKHTNYYPAPQQQYNSVINRTSIDSYAGKDKDRTGETGYESGINTLINYYKLLMIPFYAVTVGDFAPTKSFFDAMSTLYKLATLQSNIDTGTLTP